MNELHLAKIIEFGGITYLVFTFVVSRICSLTFLTHDPSILNSLMGWPSGVQQLM